MFVFSVDFVCKEELNLTLKVIGLLVKVCKKILFYRTAERGGVAERLKYHLLAQEDRKSQLIRVSL